MSIKQVLKKKKITREKCTLTLSEKRERELRLKERNEHVYIVVVHDFNLLFCIFHPKHFTYMPLVM